MSDRSDDYSDQSLVLLIPGSSLKATNPLSARPYCNRQPLKKISRIERNRENLSTRKFFTRIIFNAKISRSTVNYHVSYFYNSLNLLSVLIRDWIGTNLPWVGFSPRCCIGAQYFASS